MHTQHRNEPDRNQIRASICAIATMHDDPHRALTTLKAIVDGRRFGSKMDPATMHITDHAEKLRLIHKRHGRPGEIRRMSNVGYEFQAANQHVRREVQRAQWCSHQNIVVFE